VFFAFFVVSNIYTQQNVPYTIPRQIYIGDPAVLVVPLSSSAENHPDIITAADLPKHKYIDFHKITLERHINAGRLVIEFTPFAAGELEFPLIEVGGHYFSDLKITVNSIIDRKEAITLSSPASSLAMPGTSFMIYGLMALIVFILLFVIWFFAKGRRLVSIWREKWKRWRLFTNMRHTERRLYRALIKNTDKRIILNKLSEEFRTFLSVLTKQNCRAMTAQEIGNLQGIFPGKLPEDFFTRCDNLRFSGSSAETEDIMQLLTELRGFIDTAEGASHEF
jgi:hypothetical protein